MESHPGVAAEMFEALFSRSVNIQMISTSEIKISVLLNKGRRGAGRGGHPREVLRDGVTGKNWGEREKVPLPFSHERQGPGEDCSLGVMDLLQYDWTGMPNRPHPPAATGPSGPLRACGTTAWRPGSCRRKCGPRPGRAAGGGGLPGRRQADLAGNGPGVLTGGAGRGDPSRSF